MAEVLVRRCRVRIVRRGGWSWGPDAESFVRGMIAALPAVLARMLSEMWPQEAEAEIAAPLKMRIPVRMEELATLRTAVTARASTGAGRLPARIESLVEAVLRAKLASMGALAPPEKTGGAPETDSAASPGPASAAEVARLPRMLLEWGATGKLEFILDYLPAEEVERWHELLHAPRAEPKTQPRPEDVLRPLVVTCVEKRPPAPRLRALRMRARIEVAVEVARLGRCAPDEPVLWRLLDEHLPLEPPGTRYAGPEVAEAKPATRALAPSTSPRGGAPPAPDSQVRHDLARAPVPTPVEKAECYVRCALPFLLLEPLERCGYLDAIAACLSSLELENDTYLFAAALAYKALPAPERGWRREQAAADARVFAGVRDGISEPALASFSASMEGHLSPIRAVLVENLTRGHTPKAPLLLVPAAGELVLFDPEALIPIDCARNLRGLFLTVQKFDSPLLITPGSASVIPLNELRDAALPFLLSPAARAREERATAVWHELAELRPCAPLAAAPAFDRAMTLAAASAMGTIAWKLWREREPIDPLLVLERFGDLDARVGFSDRTVRVRLPLGGRYFELYRQGLLEPVRRVPWLGGRVLEFTGG